MNCNTNTMLKVAAGLGVILGAAYFTLPAAQSLILAYGPLLLALICPISMGVMMLMMNRSSGGKSNEGASASAGLNHKTSDVHDAARSKA